MPDNTRPTVPRSSSATLVAALRILAAEVQSGDGVANACIAEAAERIEQLDAAIREAVEYAGGREAEWGERAEECFAILERAVGRSK